MERAARVMPAGSTRSFGYFPPYPLVFERGEGSVLHDVDGNRLIDFVCNGLSLIHGHAYPPVVEAVRDAITRGSAWPGTSAAQVAFAELLCSRLPGAEQLRFTNTGTEATMLAVKLARWTTGRPLVLKAVHAYHGSFDDLEAGLGGRGEIPGRTLLATFGDIDSFREKISAHAADLAAVVIEPVLYTDNVVAPPPGFLAEVAEAARAVGALVVLDDCLMFRLAPGGSAERFDFVADITCLGKFVGGGLPVGAIGASAALMSSFDPNGEKPLYHGGSFNGNPLGAVAGRIAITDLTAAAIATMDGHADRLARGITQAGEDAGLRLVVTGDGSARGVYVRSAGGATDPERSRAYYMAAINRGVYIGAGGELAMSTTLDDALVEEALAGFALAAQDVVAAHPIPTEA
jgi:glutamate-1-semialdehyde 2,1-aminomutase